MTTLDVLLPPWVTATFFIGLLALIFTIGFRIGVYVDRRAASTAVLKVTRVAIEEFQKARNLLVKNQPDAAHETLNNAIIDAAALQHRLESER